MKQAFIALCVRVTSLLCCICLDVKMFGFVWLDEFLVCVQKQYNMVFLTAESRPKQLLVYINPYGGKRQGKRIYEQKVAPLFNLASISTDVVSE